MNIRNRLQRLTGEKPVEEGVARQEDKSRAEEIRTLRERVDAVLSRRPEGLRNQVPQLGRGRGVPLEEVVPGI